MKRLSVSIIVGSTLGLAALVAPGLAGASAEEKCQAAKLRALTKRDTCARLQQRRILLGNPGDEVSCRRAFEAALAKADRRAMRRGASCRWLDHGDGSATDLDTGLQWELKTDDGTVHDKDDDYTWSVGVPFRPDGGAFGEFLGELNDGFSSGGITVNGCFANRCDWRLPSIVELRTLEGALIPGETATGFYWTSTSLGTTDRFAWVVPFPEGGRGEGDKTFGHRVRAVRGSR